MKNDITAPLLMRPVFERCHFQYPGRKQRSPLSMFIHTIQSLATILQRRYDQRHS